MDVAAVVPDPGLPDAVLAAIDHLVGIRGLRLDATGAPVLGGRRQPQVAAAVVEAVAIDVVDPHPIGGAEQEAVEMNPLALLSPLGSATVVRNCVRAIPSCGSRSRSERWTP
jgi:hypothetical protein